jgi:uncharacterized membrane protein YkgB
MRRRLEIFDAHLVRLLRRHGPASLRIAIGAVFVWFGALKFFPELSPAEDLAGMTIAQLSFGLIEPEIGVRLLAGLEVTLGLLLMWGRGMRLVLAAVILHILGTMTPLVIFPELTFSSFPVAPTLEGQYILKNVILIAGGLVLGATVRELGAEHDPDRASVPAG